MKRYYLFFLFLLFLSISVYAQAQGFTVTSVSTSSVVTKDTDPATVFWIINTQLNGGGQSITGTLEPSTIKNLMGGKAYTKQKLSIDVNSVSEQVFYDVVDEGVPIYKYKEQTFDAPKGLFDVITGDPPPCPSGTTWDIPLGKSFFQFAKKRYCITREQVGVKGVYNNPFISFNAKIRLTVGTDIKEKTICSGATQGCDGSSVNFDNVGVATWSGSLVTGEPAPNQNNFVAIKRMDANRWQIARKSTYEIYSPYPATADSSLNSFVNLFPGYSDVTRGDTEINNAITPVNSAADTLLNEDTSFTSSPFTKDSNTGKVAVTLQRSLTSPNVVFRVRADWIGIVIPSGQPKIISVNADKFGSGETGNVNVQVQNIGESSGTFSAMLISCEPFIQSTTAQSSRKTLQAGDVDTIPISVSGGSISEDITKSCSVKVYDVNSPSISTTSGVTLQLEKAKVCIPNRVFADGNTIKKCNKDGSAIEVVENCKYSVISDGKGGFACSSNPEEKTEFECLTDDDCGNTAYCNQNIRSCIQRSGCLNVIKNGDSTQKIDVAFVGDGYSDNEELKRDVLKIVDYNGNNGINGLMSVEPFKSNRNKFNIWMVKAGDSIPMNTEYNDGPDRGKSLEVAAECTSADYQVIMSKKSFRSYAFFSGDAYLSLSSRDENQWGRLLLHEFGHSFGMLADEYVEPQMGNRPKSPNCAPNMATAQKWWGSISGTGYYEGCSYTESNVRPTFNSIMRAQWILKDDYGDVNKLELQKILNKYR